MDGGRSAGLDFDSTTAPPTVNQLAPLFFDSFRPVPRVSAHSPGASVTRANNIFARTFSEYRNPANHRWLVAAGSRLWTFLAKCRPTEGKEQRREGTRNAKTCTIALEPIPAAEGRSCTERLRSRRAREMACQGSPGTDLAASGQAAATQCMEGVSAGSPVAEDSAAGNTAIGEIGEGP